ncbi:photosystem II cytochrome PsbV2 [Gloeobacter violaceus]|uniref:Photosystem II extrinsic protein V n=1 Tax=Gloeobacter violaceus (strain ATCC 29082 / PCC 7421) TaxID=251221 RepID=C5501_GLOVI|nr:photosystem II cytochrome PsbV2 [Gloeobacter violaceus]Q7NI47.1 RecName: Full=Photosystem II extrinsic protein V; Short=PsbV; AltName: Full=Cytochrome c-550 1; AltName: Full=Cytochrome c550 1; AltName: Full=Low-potential cytochrome c 1; Flags: Precursor [Gloeobacter violaceus PCC 7421]BAC90278.1 cytochrome c550 [Gloeobacter violaceus PCC 7421]
MTFGHCRRASTLRSAFVLGLCGLLLAGCSGADDDRDAAALKDKYVTVNLGVRGPVDLPADGVGNLQTFSPQQIYAGKKLFESNCQNCHVGGTTTPNPKVSLALAKLQGATPPRDNIQSLVQYMRLPMSYDGSEETFNCRKSDWIEDDEAQNLAAFILRASQKARGWGTARLEANQDSMTTAPP